MLSLDVTTLPRAERRPGVGDPRAPVVARSYAASGMTPEEFEADCAAIATDLETLQTLLE